MKPRSVFLIAGELSGDRYGARLLAALRRQAPAIRAEAIGGPYLRMAGAALFRDSSDWGAIGVTEALRVYPRAKAAQVGLKRHLAANPPDLLLPIDFGAFNVPTAARARALGIQVIYVIPPGSWRPDGGRVSTRLARCADCFLTPFQPSERVLRNAGLDAAWLGHPLLDFLPDPTDREKRRTGLGLTGEGPILGILPGSRRQEIRHLAPVFLTATRRLAEKFPSLRAIVPLAPNAARESMDLLLHQLGWERSPASEPQPLSTPDPDALVDANANAWSGRIDRYNGAVPLVVAPGRALDALSVCDAALVCSGTATLEAALLGCPMVIGYRGGGASLVEYVLRKTMVPDTIGLPNLLLGRMLCPELIQKECRPDRILEEVTPLLSSTLARFEQLDGFSSIRGQLGEPGVIERWAEAILERFEAGAKTRTPSHRIQEA